MTFGGKDAMATRSCIQSALSACVRSVCDQHGYKLKKEQEEAIMNFISGKDVFVCLPTGYGKSVCFMFLPEIMDVVHSRTSGTSIVLVVTPLTSLMKDQVDACISHGVKAVAVSSETESKNSQFHLVANGEFQLVYISPEMILCNKKWRNALQNRVYQLRLCGLIVDEAHCVKKWYD